MIIRAAAGTRQKATRSLRITRDTLRDKMKKFNLFDQLSRAEGRCGSISDRVEAGRMADTPRWKSPQYFPRTTYDTPTTSRVGRACISGRMN